MFPDKLLQFRPLDGLRADLLTVAGAAACLIRLCVTACYRMGFACGRPTSHHAHAKPADMLAVQSPTAAD